MYDKQSVSDHFTFADNGLGLEFTDKGRLQEFFTKTRELYPDLSIVLTSVFRSDDYETCEWILQNTVTETLSETCSGKCQFRFTGASIVQVEQGAITRWADYYDGLTARRTALGAYFTEWIEL